MKVDSPAVNPFAPYAPILGLYLYVGEELHEEGRIYTEVRGSDNWLCQDGDRFYVVDSDDVCLSEKYWNPGYAVRAVTELEPELAALNKQVPVSF